jgi:hypothetical protein
MVEDGDQFAGVVRRSPRRLPSTLRSAQPEQQRDREREHENLEFLRPVATSDEHDQLQLAADDDLQS